MTDVLSDVGRSLAPRRAFGTLLLALAGVAACGGSTEPKKDVIPASIAAATTDTLRAQAGAVVNTALSVTVKNAAGQPIDSALITFAVGSGGGSLSATTVRTDSLGRATTTWTLGTTAGVQTVTATAGVLPSVTFVAVASAAAAASMTKLAGDAQTAVAGSTVTTRPAVKVADQFGNPVTNTTVTFAVASGGGQLTGASATTDAGGVATVGSWRLGGTAGANSLTATTQGIPAVTFTATGTVGAVAQLRFTNTAPVLNSGQSFKLTVLALDANNNTISNPTLTFTSDNGAIATVDAGGTVTGVGAGSATITAAAGSVSVGQAVSVIGHPTMTLIGSVAMNSRIRDASISGNTVYGALSTSQSVGAVDMTTATLLWNSAQGGPVFGAVANSANTLITAATGGLTPQFYIINPATHLATDSIALSAPAVKMVMNSTGTRALVDENNFLLEVVDVASKSIVAQPALPGTVTAMKMARGDSLVYAGTALGVVFEVNASTGVIRRQFQPSNTVVDLDISADGKTLFVADGTSIVTMVRLATGGLNGTVDFAANVQGVGITPDGKQLWASTGSTIVGAPAFDNTFNTSLVGGRLTITGATLKGIYFSKLGNFAVVIDDGGNQLVILK